MKKELKYILGAHLALVLYLVFQTFDLMTLLHDDSFSDALLDHELNPVGGVSANLVIPKIIHQTYKTTEIPEIWKSGQQACIDLHPDYQYFLWTDDMAREFIAESYPWFLDTWDSYPYPIQRADAIRYFALVKYGGVYIDLDDGCARRLDPLLTVPAFVRKTIPTGISNDVMGSVPNHPFFIKATESLKTYKRNWFVPYITIMYSTGPLFLSVVWKQYKRWGVPESGKVRILFPQDYKIGERSFFAIAPGSSWHMDDAKFVKGLANHIVLAVFGGFLIAGLVFYLEYLFYSYVSSAHFKKVTKKIKNGIFGIAGRVVKFDSAPMNSSRPESRLNFFKLIKFKLSGRMKKRSRKDSNIPMEFDLLEKLNNEQQDNEQHQSQSSHTASGNTHSQNSSSQKHYDHLHAPFSQENSSEDDYEEDDSFLSTHHAKDTDNIV